MINQDTCSHDWRDSYSIGVAGTLIQSLECEKCGLRSYSVQKEEVSASPKTYSSPPPDDV